MYIIYTYYIYTILLYSSGRPFFLQFFFKQSRAFKHPTKLLQIKFTLTIIGVIYYNDDSTDSIINPGCKICFITYSFPSPAIDHFWLQ